MRILPTREALVAAYWRKLTRFNGAADSGRGRVSVRRAAQALRTHRRRASRGAVGSVAATALRPRAQFDPI